tara:strand:- start:41 stop:307 length:267 start_codon:yes stop_codon:yes gene_type:complete
LLKISGRPPDWVYSTLNPEHRFIAIGMRFHVVDSAEGDSPVIAGGLHRKPSTLGGDATEMMGVHPCLLADQARMFPYLAEVCPIFNPH